MAKFKKLWQACLWISTFLWNTTGAINPQRLTLALLDRIQEPILLPKGEVAPIAFHVPHRYINSHFQPFAQFLETEATAYSTNETFIVKDTEELASAIVTFGVLSKEDTFSTFIPKHMNLASRLTKFFMDQTNTRSFFNAAAALRDNINPGLFVHSFSVAVTHRSDCLNLRLPPLYEIFPSKFFNGAALINARQTARMIGQSTPAEGLAAVAAAQSILDLESNPTASIRDPEFKLAYFREDVGLNLHHWNWHLIYPFQGPKEVVNKDRRGELFYYAHQQIMARYNTERLCNSLPFVEKLSDFSKPIVEGYFPKLFTLSASKNWAGRPPGSIMKDIDREADEIIFEINELEQWRSRIMDAIYKGRAQKPDGSTIELDAFGGIDILGNIVEPTVHSLNIQYYNNFHNFLHLAVAWIHDPRGNHLETVSLVGETQTAMRDPVFYRIHSHVNDIFHKFKETLPSYEANDLAFNNIRIANLEVAAGARTPNCLFTFWGRRTVDLSRGLDFFPRNPVSVKFKYLDHQNFTYAFTILNNNAVTKHALFRIFFAPKYGDSGEQLSYNRQRRLFFELDKFDVQLKPGLNTFTRESLQSTITVPFAQAAKTLEYNETVMSDPGRCGCGWPHNLLIPKGNETGFPGVLFAMASNYLSDWNSQKISIQSGECKIASSYCGIFNKKYPDKKSMGYPFDRISTAKTLTAFMDPYPNMYAREIKVFHEDTTVDKKSLDYADGQNVEE